MVSNDPASAYNLNGAHGDSESHWYDVQYWSRKVLVISVLAVIIVIVVIVAMTIIEKEKKNAYPDYSQLKYTLVDQYMTTLWLAYLISGTSFFDKFDYFTGYDPTAGFVHYLTLEQAIQFNLTAATPSSAILQVDTSQQNASTGSYSVRITSRKTYNNGPFTFDIMHTPYGCATWPAFWLTDPANWPMYGEVDVMEAVNEANSGNQMTLHTADEYSMSVKRKEAGNVLTNNCYYGTNSNSGCSGQCVNSTFGPLFNAGGGGIIALEIRTAGIRMWQFGRSNIPVDITNNVPDPSTWPEALADFPNTNCDIATHLGNLSVIAEIDICGSWAGNPAVYNTQNSCPGIRANYAALNPSAFVDAYWEFGPTGFTVYQAA